MTDPGFTVSVPDLIGFSDQIGDLGVFYEDLGQAVAEQSIGLSFLPAGNAGGQLCGVLTFFMDDFAALVEAERAAAVRLGDGLSATQEALHDVARNYQEMDQAAMGTLHQAVPSEEDQAIDAAIDQNGQNSDWSRRLVVEDYVGDVNFEPPQMTYTGPYEEFNTLLGVAGNLPATIDAIIEAIFNISIIKTITIPLLGNWGFLWVMRDACRAEARGFEAASMVLADGTTTLVGTDWTGAAADAFAGHIEATKVTLDGHVANLDAAATLFGSVGDQIDKAANDLADLINELINSVITVFMAVLNAGSQIANRFVDFVGGLADGLSAGAAATGGIANLLEGDIWEKIKNTAGPLVKKIITGLEALCAAIKAADTRTKTLCDEANALQPPPLPTVEAGGTTTGAEGLSEEHVELTEEPR
jgi:hypothetical protein